MSADRPNDFALKIATINGTGSASANGLLLQAIFRMGVPVSGKNLFPSNIQGLPTWYEIRVSGEGYTSRAESPDLMVVLNPATQVQDVAEVRPGGWVLHDSSWLLKRDAVRPDLHYLGIPFARLCNERFEGSRDRILLRNVAYLGALAALLDVEVEVVEGLITETYGGKQKLLDANFTAFGLGYDQARETLDCPLPIRLRRMAANDDAVLIDGNTATALGCLYGGATVAAWYPITPSTSVVDAFAAFAARYRRDPETGGLRVAIVQAEDELAAAGMVIGAGWMGARSFTATSGPGISLMGEFIGLAYYAEIPSVFIDVQRTGPSTGMPTRTQQADLLAVVYASHGDTKHIALFPADPHECFHFAARSFDLAERFQTPVFLVTDLDIGMNDWVVPRLRWDDTYRPDRGKVLSAEDLDAGVRFVRYMDVDGDGIPYRTRPGDHRRGAYFTRGSGHDSLARYTEDGVAYQEVVDRIARKIQDSATSLPEPEIQATPGAACGIVTVGGCRAAVLEARDRLARHGVLADVLRVRAFPFHPEVGRFLERHDRVFVVEQNRDGQLRGLLATETGVPITKLTSLRFYGGMPLSWGPVVDRVLAELGLARDGVGEPQPAPDAGRDAPPDAPADAPPAASPPLEIAG
jgi:2-oxoglutarate/2-oxoacid ferredoxin oxidoreductase subunit alpha